MRQWLGQNRCSSRLPATWILCIRFVSTINYHSIIVNTFLLLIVLHDSTAAEATYFASFGEGNGLIAIGNLRCTGHETRLVDCPSGVTTSCTHREDAGVRCTGKVIVTRLVKTSHAQIFLLRIACNSCVFVVNSALTLILIVLFFL